MAIDQLGHHMPLKIQLKLVVKNALAHCSHLPSSPYMLAVVAVLSEKIDHINLGVVLSDTFCENNRLMGPHLINWPYKT